MRETISEVARPGLGVTPAQVAGLISRVCPPDAYRRQRVLLIVPDGTRTAPVGLIFQALYRQIGAATKDFDVLIALGTHQPMTETAICHRRSEEHTSELQSPDHLVCRLLLEKKKTEKKTRQIVTT